MRPMRWIAVLVGALLAMGGLVPSASAAGEVTGRVVHETVPGVIEYVTDPITEITETIFVSPPVYEGVPATVIAYGPTQGGRPGEVDRVQTDAEGNFTFAGLTGSVYLEVLPTSTDWQNGWVWVETKTDWPGYASLLQQAPPATFDVTPGMDLGMLQPLTAVASGRVVDLATGDGIAGATVRYDPVDTGRKACSTTTNADGYYAVGGLDGEEYAIRASARRYVGGYLGEENVLYATFGEAATHPGGQLTDPIRMARR